MNTGVLNISDGNAIQTEKYIVGNFTRDMATASGTQAITSLGFKPSAVQFRGGLDGAVGQIFWGYDDGTNANMWVDHGSVNPQTHAHSITVSVFNDQSASGINYGGQIQSLDADGFTIDWTRAGAPTGILRIHFIAFK